MPDRVRIFDTTLRDGEQSPGIALKLREKVEIAEQLARLGVDVIEAGFPVTSPGDFAAVAEIAKVVRGPVIAALARTADADIDTAAEAVRAAERPRIHTFVSTSATHLTHQLRKTEDEVVAMARRAVARARNLVPDVEFSAMDATRSDPAFLCRVFAEAVAAGATTLNVPDTVGYALPSEFQALVRRVMEGTPGIEKVIVSVHCHNDLGLAVANSLAAVEAGARQVECAINGLGERAGNASLEEIVMILDTRADLLGLATGIRHREIAKTSRLVSLLTGYAVQPNKAIVGENAFAHESGIHQDGVLKERSCYEIMRPERIGLEPGGGIVVGKHSGRHAVQAKLAEAGLVLTEAQFAGVFEKFKALADKKKRVTTRDLEALAIDEMGEASGPFVLEHVQSFGGTTVIPTAAVRVVGHGKTIEATARGDGQIDAVCNAIAKATKFQFEMVSFHVNAVTDGPDAQGKVTIKLAAGGRQAVGQSVGTDVVETSARAYLGAINRLVGGGA
jgi:2-isopropylmalate synthase